MLSILGIGHAHPPNRITNAFLEELGVAEEKWSMQRVGIRERRTALPLDYIRKTRNANPMDAFELVDEAGVSATQQAAQMALRRAGISSKDIGLVISGSSAPTYTSPAQASRLAAALDLEVPAFDTAAACSTFALHMYLASGLTREAIPDYALLIQHEFLSASVDYTDRNTAILFGDCVTAAIVSHVHPGRLEVRKTVFEGYPSQWKKITIRAGSHVHMNGVPVQNYAVRQTAALLNKIAISGIRPIFVGHQASMSILDSVCRVQALAPSEHWFNVDWFGNSGGAGAPSVLSEHWEEIDESTTISLVVVGAGLSAGAVSLSGSTHTGRRSE